MQINYIYDDVKASARLEELTTKRLNKLVDKYDFLVKAEVLFKKENTSTPETGMICQITLSAPGPNLFAESSHKNFEMSIAEATEELERQLHKKKEKMRAK